MEKTSVLLLSIVLAVGLVAGIFIQESITGNALFNSPNTQKNCLLSNNDIVWSSPYVIEDTVRDLYRDSRNTTANISNARVLRLKLTNSIDQGITAGGYDTEEVYIYSKNPTTNPTTTTLELYKKEQGGSKAVLFATVNPSSGGSASLFQLRKGITILDVGISRKGNGFTLDIEGGTHTFLRIYFEAKPARQINYIGHSDSNAVITSDVVYNHNGIDIDISDYNRDTLLPLSGVIVLNPAGNARSDKVQFKISDGTYSAPRQI